MSDPLNAASLNAGGRPESWVGFDEISMTTPNPNAEQASRIDEDDRRPSVAREESLDMASGRNSVATEERLEVDDGDRPVLTPLPTNEFIADPAKLGQAPVVHVSQDYSNHELSEKSAPKTFITSGGIELKNGKLLATIFPENNACAWIIPPRYDPHCMPAILAADGITVPVDDFITAMELITNDYRFRSFSTLYSRLIAFWLVISIVVLLAVLFANSQGGLPVMFFTLVWMFMLFAGIVGCAILKRQIRIGLRHCVESANKVLLKHNVLVGVEDKGQLSCHKVVIHFVWFRLSDCMPDVERLIRIEASGGAVVYGGEAHSAPAKEMTKKEIEDKARQLLLKYGQGYVKDSVKHRIFFPTRPSHGVSDYVPKHCAKQQCVCQYIDKNHFNRTPKKWYARYV